MGDIRSDTPAWVDAILDWPGTWIIARTGLTCAFWIGGLSKLFDWNTALAEQAHFGLQPAWLFAAATIFVELVGPFLLIWGRWVWLAAGALGVFTGLTAIIASPFWALSGQARFMATNTFLEHIGLISGFVLAAILARRPRRDHAR